MKSQCRLLLLPLALFGSINCISEDEAQIQADSSRLTAANPDIRFVAIEKDRQSINFRKANYTYVPELPPMIIANPAAQGGGFHYVVSSSFSEICHSPLNIINNSTIALSNCLPFSSPDIYDRNTPTAVFMKPPASVNLTTPWKFSYNGVTGIAKTPHGVITVKHNENQNTLWPDGAGNPQRYQSVIYPNVPASTCAAGYYGGVYIPCWESFSGWVTTGTNTNAAYPSLLRESSGPVIWPRDGYRTTTLQRLSSGPYHPTLFVHDDKAYIYYTDWEGPGGSKCTMVARANAAQVASNAANPWRKFTFAAGFTSPAMPAGFNPASYEQFLDDTSGSASCIFRHQSSSQDPIWMNVAKVRNTPYFIAAEETTWGTTGWQVGVRLSTDLVNWSDLKVISVKGGGTWGVGDLSYPTLVDKNGQYSNAEVDADEFYILGNAANSSTGYGLTRIKASLRIPTLVSTPLAREVAVVKNYYLHFLDWDISPSDAGVMGHAPAIARGDCKGKAREFVSAAAFLARRLNAHELVKTYYRALLGRDPDPAGMDYWLNQIRAANINSGNATATQRLVDMFFATQEARNACTNRTVYLNFYKP